MRKAHLYLLALVVASIGIAGFLYKWQVMGFPVQPLAEAEVWNLQARVEFRARSGPNKVTLQLPADAPGFAILDEKFVNRNYGKTEERSGGDREVQWAIRRASGTQVLYYRATVYRDGHKVEDTGKPEVGTPLSVEEPYSSAVQTLLEGVREQSADIVTFARQLVRQMNMSPPGPEVELLAELYETPEQRAQFIAGMLSARSIPARVIHGLELQENRTVAELQPWLQVHNGERWSMINLRNAEEGWPDNLFLWSRSDKPALAVEDNPRASVEFTVQRNVADAMMIAEQRAELIQSDLIRYSLLDLPIDVQSTYAVLLMVPVGAFLMLLLRNLVGVKTFGTFMPVLIALAFRETQLIGGVSLFVIVVGLGLLVRFYMEKLRLLLVPRLTAVLILVVLLMALVSVVSHRLNIEVGLSVALFPMVIMAMTIERMSVAWEERGGAYALKEGIGSLIVACIAYLAMSWDVLEHLMFVFPELLLVLFAATLVIGRYSGYRLTELFRFRALAREGS